MSKTLLTIRDSDLRVLINETDKTTSGVSDTVLNSFINQAVRFITGIVEDPRSFYEITAVLGQNEYTVATDTLLIRTAYFGDKTVAGDIRPLQIMSEETLKEIKRNWLETNSVNRGTPLRLIKKTRDTVFIDPAPDGASSASGKKLTLGYVFEPATLSSDSDIPDVAVPYHDLIQFYAAHLFYLFKQNSAMSAEMNNQFISKIKVVMPSVTKETKEGFGWQWGFSDDVNDDTNDVGAIVFP